MLDYEKKYDKNTLIAGCDEAGRGSWAGPIVVACVIMKLDYKNSEINDSKKLSIKKRNDLYQEIIQNSIEHQIIIRSVEDLNNSNPKKESQIGMELAVKNMKTKPNVVLTDFEKINIDIPQENIIKGDSVSFNIAAASILAKVFRDNYMIELDKKYPQYDLKNNKGYGTKSHSKALIINGIEPKIHRRKYKPIAKFIEKITN
ncbi:ribonuclease HII [Mycoplasma sp. CSL7503-lung]|uniref:ribonuclease HII n=1 Tax=Mycoplasma sp. CSL7503-lung TaxID=536372 RepID=UPI0021CF4D9C|nr:ribonuclease HII [Mycoplasma sp. CSL7503-lung]MCU4706773.1 ribonuclease HII [Mycoplasma sp. CSL7503-lung]